jgi:hypothetical protein
MTAAAANKRQTGARTLERLGKLVTALRFAADVIRQRDLVL